MLKLKLQYFGHLRWRPNSLEKTCWKRLKAGGEGDNRGRDGWMASPTWWTWAWANSGRCVLLSKGVQRVRHDWVISSNNKTSKTARSFRFTSLSPVSVCVPGSGAGAHTASSCRFSWASSHLWPFPSLSLSVVTLTVLTCTYPLPLQVSVILFFSDTLMNWSQGFGERMSQGWWSLLGASYPEVLDINDPLGDVT